MAFEKGSISAHFGTPAQPAGATRFAQMAVFMSHIAQLTDGGFALGQYHADLAGGQLDHHIAILFGH